MLFCQALSTENAASVTDTAGVMEATGVTDSEGVTDASDGWNENVWWKLLARQARLG